MSNTPSKDQLLGMYRRLAEIRACDEAIRTGVGGGKLVFFYFPITGQEAIPAAICEVISPDDQFVVTYRGFHHQLAKGVPFENILGEMTGKEKALHKGKSGPMHICDPEVGLMMTTGIVGGTLPPAVGLALANKHKKNGKVVICFHGDGAVNEGSWHEAMNLAAIWKLPIVFVCENNKYSETVPSDEVRSGTILDRARAYEMSAETVNGYDPVAMFDVMTRAVEQARSGKGPYFVDAECFRFFGHYFGDPMVAVPKEELESEMANDPFETYKARLVDSGEFSADELDAIKEEYDKEAAAVVEANVAAGPVSAEGLNDGVYANPVSVR